MAESRDVVQTDVDGLIKLVKEKKEISFDDVAEELGLPVITIESWANFLEEEGMLSITYKFTTPYLVYEKQQKGIKSENLDRVTSGSTEIQNSLNMLVDHVRSQDYDSAHKESVKLHKMFKALLVDVARIKKLSKKINNESLNQRIDNFTHFISHAKTLIAKGDNERVKAAFKHIHNEFIDILKEINDPIDDITGEEKDIEDDIKEIEDKESEHFDISDIGLDRPKGQSDRQKDEGDKVDGSLGKDSPPELDLKIKDSDDYNQLIQKAYKYMEEGNWEYAKKIYDFLETDYNSLSFRFKEKRNSLKEALLSLNKELSSNFSEESSKEAEKIYAEIEKEIPFIKQDIEKKDFDSAEKKFREIETKYNKMPDGFLEKKILLENDMIDIHASLIENEKSKYSTDVQAAKDRIKGYLTEINILLSKKDTKKALEVYEKAKKEFDDLPAGFLEVKINLEEGIFSAYRAILLESKSETQEEINEKIVKIENLIRNIDLDLSKEDFESALKNLHEADTIFDSLPEGFLETKMNVENKLLAHSKKISSLRKEHSKNKFTVINGKIDKLFTKFDSYIGKKEYDLAEGVYKEIINLFSHFPEGYLKEKIELKSRILEAYKKILLNSDSEYLHDAKEDSKRKYQAILKIIISIHEHIENKEFDMIDVKYNHIISLYNELSIGFAQKKISIRHEILKIYDEIQLYKKAKALGEMYGNVSDGDFKAALDNVHALHDELYEECKEDYELFEYVKKIYDEYSFHMKGKGHFVKHMREKPPLYDKSKEKDPLVKGSDDVPPPPPEPVLGNDADANMPPAPRPEGLYTKKEKDHVEAPDKNFTFSAPGKESSYHPEDEGDEKDKSGPDVNFFGRKDADKVSGPAAKVNPDNIRDRDKARKISEIFEESINLLLKGKMDEAYTDLKVLLSIEQNNQNALYLVEIIIKMKQKSILKEFKKEILVFFKLMRFFSKLVEKSLDAKLARIKLIRGFYECLRHNYKASLIDLKRLREIYVNNDEVSELLRLVQERLKSS